MKMTSSVTASYIHWHFRRAHLVVPWAFYFRRKREILSGLVSLELGLLKSPPTLCLALSTTVKYSLEYLLLANRFKSFGECQFQCCVWFSWELSECHVSLFSQLHSKPQFLLFLSPFVSCSNLFKVNSLKSFAPLNFSGNTTGRETLALAHGSSFSLISQRSLSYLGKTKQQLGGKYTTRPFQGPLSSYSTVPQILKDSWEVKYSPGFLAVEFLHGSGCQICHCNSHCWY